MPTHWYDTCKKKRSILWNTTNKFVIQCICTVTLKVLTRKANAILSCIESVTLLYSNSSIFPNFCEDVLHDEISCISHIWSLLILTDLPKVQSVDKARQSYSAVGFSRCLSVSLYTHKVSYIWYRKVSMNALLYKHTTTMLTLGFCLWKIQDKFELRHSNSFLNYVYVEKVKSAWKYRLHCLSLDWKPLHS